MSTLSLRERAARCLRETDPVKKCAMLVRLSADPPTHPGEGPIEAMPGRPARPALVHPRDLPRRRLTTASGHAAFIHAICHIEFTAINLALDAVVSFTAMPARYYADWLAVAAEEATHYTLLARHLETLGSSYGAFVAHDGLWDMARRTRGDVVRRMALIPRVMEARGLDVTPGMIERLRAIGDTDGVRILERILAEEIGHVRIGSRWFHYACATRGLDPAATFTDLVSRELGRLRGAAFNRAARLAAGFTVLELDALGASADPGSSELAASAGF